MIPLGQNELTKQIYKAVASVVDFICRNPLIHVSETDIHALMIHELYKIPTLSPEKLYGTNYGIGINRNGSASSKKYKTMLIHKEYGHNSTRYARSDIVILGKENVKNIDDPINLKSKKRYLIPDYKFEFGTEKAGEYSRHLESDLKKLGESKVVGFLIHLHRNYINAPKASKTLSKNQEKYKNMDSITKEKWKAVKVKDNLKIIVCLIEIGNKGRRVKSKVKIFNPAEGKMKSVNLKRISGEVLSILDSWKGNNQ